MATCPSTPPTDSITGLAPAARTIEYPGVITSESPATQMRSFRFGRERDLRGRRRRAGVGFASAVGGFGVGRGVDGRRRRAIAVSISSLPAADRVLHGRARPVEPQGVADVRERAGEGERDVALPALGLC